MLDRGSTPHFVVAMVIFHDFAEAEKASETIGRLRERLKVWPEFRFSKSRDEIRDAFFGAVVQHDFIVRAIVVEKAYVYSGYLRTSTDSFYNFFVQLLMKHDEGVLRGAHVKIDGSGDRKFKKTLESYLRRQVGTGKIRKVKFANSRSDNLIQLADMTVGAIARSYRAGSRREHNRWRQMLAPKIDNVWEFR